MTGGIFNNNFTNTVASIANATAGTIDASGNWWGTNTEAGILAELSGSVDYTPWLNASTDTSGDPGSRVTFPRSMSARPARRPASPAAFRKASISSLAAAR